MWLRRTTRITAALAALVVSVTACTASQDDARTPDALPQPTRTSPPESPTTPPPDQATEQDRWLAPFNDVPYSVGGMFVGMVFPASNADTADLTVVGVDPSGATRWALRTNPSCVGYDVTEVNGRPAAVVLASDADTRADGIATRITANAYDTRDGRQLWGPSPVPGPLLGPGLIFGQSGSSVVGDTRAETVMLAADTGEPVDPPADDAVPRYEHNGVGLFGTNESLTAIDTRIGSPLWESDDVAPDWAGAKARAEFLPTPAASNADVVALRWHDTNGDTRTALHDLRSGTLIAALDADSEPRTTLDPTTNTVVVTSIDYRASHAIDVNSGRVRWRDNGASGPLELTLADSGVGYGNRDGRSVAIDLRTGDVLYEGNWPSPVAASADVLITPHQPASADTTARKRSRYVGYRRP